MSPVHVEVSERVRDRSVVKGGKNAAGEVIIGGRRLKICPKTVRECKLAVPNASRSVVCEQGGVKRSFDTKRGIR